MRACWCGFVELHTPAVKCLSFVFAAPGRVAQCLCRGHPGASGHPSSALLQRIPPALLLPPVRAQLACMCVYTTCTQATKLLCTRASMYWPVLNRGPPLLGKKGTMSPRFPGTTALAMSAHTTASPLPSRRGYLHCIARWRCILEVRWPTPRPPLLRRQTRSPTTRLCVC